MRIINKTKNTLLAKDAVVASKLFKRTKGLLDRSNFRLGEALIIKPCKSIHTWFMLFPIDVLFVDENNRVVKAIPDIKPFRITPIYWKAEYVIELPIGMIQKTETCESDLLTLEQTD